MATSNSAPKYSTFSASTVQPSNLDCKHESQWNQCCCFLCRLSSSFILHPVGPFRAIWDGVVMVLLIYTSIEIPYAFAFGQSTYILWIGLFVDCILFTDILFNFHTAYFDKYDNLRLVTNKKYICQKYLRTWFLIDFATCIPFEFIDYNQNMNNVYDADSSSNALMYIKILRIFRLLRIIKLFRLFKIVKIFDVFRKRFIVREAIFALRLFKILFSMLIFAHFAACIWWFVGLKTSPSWIDKAGLRSDDIDAFTKYSFSWYWSVVTLFTTGYGDIVATNTSEQWVSSICIIVGTCFFAYFVGTLTVLIAEGDKMTSYAIDKIDEAQLFCDKKRLPIELTHAICTHIRYYCRYNYVFDENELLSMLPSYLQHDIHSCVAKQFLLNLGIFQNEYINLPPFIIGLIAVKCKAMSCNQSFKLYNIGDVAKEFYIQRTGKSLMYDKNNKILQHLSRGSVCGAYSSIVLKKRKANIVCDTWSEFYCISVDDIRQILNEYYPNSSHSKWQRIKQYMKISHKKKVKHHVHFTTDINTFYQTSPSLHTAGMRHGPSLPSVIKALSNSDSENQPQISGDDIKEDMDMDELPKCNPISNGTASVNKSVISNFKIRSNSAHRNVVVIAHDQKYHKTSVELAALGINDGDGDGGDCGNEVKKDVDSEFSLSLSSVISESTDIKNDVSKALNKKKTYRNNKVKQTKQRRTNMGKFGVRRGGKFNVKGKYGLMVHQHDGDGESESDNESDNEKDGNINDPSFDSCTLLTALDYNDKSAPKKDI